MSDWRKGSQWFEINRELALRIVEDNTYYPKLKGSHYFQTMLTINTPHLLANRSLTYVDWSSFMLIHLVQPIKEVHGHNLVKGYSILYELFLF